MTSENIIWLGGSKLYFKEDEHEIWLSERKTDSVIHMKSGVYRKRQKGNKKANILTSEMDELNVYTLCVYYDCHIEEDSKLHKTAEKYSDMK